LGQDYSKSFTITGCLTLTSLVTIIQIVPAAPNPRRRWIALSVVCLGMTMNILDQTIVNVALPTIQRDLHFTQANLAWVIDAYLITFGGLLLLAGRLGDLVGRKRIFLSGVIVFTLSSALCGLSTSQGLLIGARFAQGAGAAFSASVVLAIIVQEFPDAVERTRAMSTYILVAVGGGSLGLLLGGILTQVLSWHWIFFINVPIGVATVIAGIYLLDENEGLGIKAGLDIAGALLSTIGLMLAIYAVVTSTTYGWRSAHTLAYGAAAVVVLAAFAVLETRLKAPMMPLRVLRSPGLVPSSLARACMVIGMYGTFFLGVLFLQHLHGFGAMETGFAFLPQTITVAIMSLGPTARLSRLLQPKRTALVGFGVLGIGLLLFAFASPVTPYFPQLFFALLLIGLGAALCFTPLLTIALAQVPPADAGLGSGIVNVSQQVSAALAVAVLGVVSSNRTASLLASGASTVHALASGYRLGFIVGIGGVIAGILICVFLVRVHPVPEDLSATDEELASVVESVDI
jgi:EmrB/QacA subfamily drug resistance transporter